MKDWIRLADKMPDTDERVMIYTSNGIEGTGRWRDECVECPLGEWFDLEFYQERPLYDYFIGWRPIKEFSEMGASLKAGPEK